MSADNAARLLLVLAVVNAAMTGVLIWAAFRLPEPALHERAETGVVLSIAAMIFALLGAARLGWVELAPGVGLNALVVAGVLCTVPSLLWVADLVKGRFR